MDANKLSASDIFQCKQCGECCVGYGGTYVTKTDIKNIADYINSDYKKFVDEFCNISGTKPLLATADNGKCIFFHKHCTIHPVKPYMCKAWPFIKNILAEPANWNIMANSCPGMKKDIPYDLLCKIVKMEIAKKHSF